MTILTIPQIAAAWNQGGGDPSKVIVAVSVALAESSGDTEATSGTSDYGLWQINSVHAGEFQGFWDLWDQPLANAQYAINISSNGQNWAPWATCYANIYASGWYGSLSYPEHGSAAYSHIAAVTAALGGGSSIIQPPATWPRLANPPRIDGILEIPLGMLGSVGVNFWQLVNGGILPPPDDGSWAFFHWGGGSWGQYSPGDELLSDAQVAMVPPGSTYPGLIPRAVVGPLPPSDGNAAGCDSCVHVDLPPPPPEGGGYSAADVTAAYENLKRWHNQDAAQAWTQMQGQINTMRTF